MKVGLPWLRGPLVGSGVQAQFHIHTSAFTLNVVHSGTQGLEGTKGFVFLLFPPVWGEPSPASGGTVDFGARNGF